MTIGKVSLTIKDNIAKLTLISGEELWNRDFHNPKRGVIDILSDSLPNTIMPSVPKVSPIISYYTG